VSSSAEQIRALVIAYAERLDAGDLDGVAALFEHGTFKNARGGKPRTGATEVRRMYDQVRIFDDGTPHTKHVLGNLDVEVDEESDTASAACTFTVLQAADGSIRAVLAGRYLDRFVRVDGEWRFFERVVDPHLIGDLSTHMGA
jgi:ketosteroid isomerase-like protein